MMSTFSMQLKHISTRLSVLVHCNLYNTYHGGVVILHGEGLYISILIMIWGHCQESVRSMLLRL